MDDLVRWLGEQLDEDERIARAATPGPWAESGVGEFGWGVSFGRAGAGVEAEDGDQGRADAAFIAAHDPARVLREIDTKRAILALHTQSIRDGGCQVCDVPGGRRLRPDACTTVRLLALPYADRPGYREEWAP